MKYVLDASVALKWVLPEEGSERAIALQEQFADAEHELIAPDTFAVEVAHALTRAERRGNLQPPEGLERFRQIAASFPQFFPYIPLLPRAMEISSNMRVGVYDCLYIALAERENCPLVTADDRLAKTFTDQAVSLASL